MGRKKDFSQELKMFVQELGKDIDIHRVILFGSRVRGKTGKDADVDLIIVSPDFEEYGFFERGARVYDYWKLDLPVDFLCYTPKEFNRLKKKISIVKEAIDTGKEIIV